MAEGLLKSIWPEGLKPPPVVQSAGTHATAGLPPEPHAVRVLHEYGIDISAHRSQPLEPNMAKRADLILTMTQQHFDFIINLARGESVNVRLLCGFGTAGEFVDVPDPYGGSLHTYRDCARMIYGCLERVIIRFNGYSELKKNPDSIS
jgi:protein-tyrosine-phosphatase